MHEIPPRERISSKLLLTLEAQKDVAKIRFASLPMFGMRNGSSRFLAFIYRWTALEELVVGVFAVHVCPIWLVTGEESREFAMADKATL